MRTALESIVMKHLLAISCLMLATLSALRAAEPAAPQDAQVVAAMKEIQAQQAQIADNQAKIEAKMAVIAEAVRMAKIYASRAGH
jgi:ABC-type transporter MlaC component